MLAASLKPGAWMYSALDLDTLACLRDANSQVYLGVIVGPEREASHVNVEKLQALAKRFSPRADQAITDSSKAYEGMFNRQHLNENSMDLIAHQLSPMGFHVDAATLAKAPNLLKYAKSQKAKVFSYSTQGNASHLNNLSRLKAATGSLPDGMIIDGRQDQFCDQLKIISPS